MIMSQEYASYVRLSTPTVSNVLHLPALDVTKDWCRLKMDSNVAAFWDS